MEKEILKNIRKIYKLRTEKEHQEGLSFYRDAHQECFKLAKKYNITVHQAIGVVSVLSPMTRWEQNILIADQYIGERKSVHTLTQCKKAGKILETTDVTEIVKIIGGEKTTNFFWNIYKYDDANHITVDRWAARIAFDKDVIKVTPKEYTFIKNVHIKEGKRLKMLGLELQAITWLTKRRLDKENKLKKNV